MIHTQIHRGRYWKGTIRSDMGEGSVEGQKDWIWDLKSSMAWKGEKRWSKDSWCKENSPWTWSYWRLSIFFYWTKLSYVMIEIKFNICSEVLQNWNFITSLYIGPHAPYMCTVRNLSYSHINMWKNCNFHFWKHRLKTWRFSLPSQPTWGSRLHSVYERAVH